jgi:hypothetical protein
MAVFWVVVPCNLVEVYQRFRDPIGGGNKDLKNVGKLLPDYVRLEVLTAVSMKISVFWVIALCSLVDVNQRFRGHTASIIRAMNEAALPLKLWLT